MKRMKKNNRGFTLIELVDVMVIIGILSIIAVPTYRVYILRAMAAEGLALASSIAKTELMWYAEHGSYHAVPDGGPNEIANGGAAGGIVYNPRLEIDARMNTYFRGYQVSIQSGGDEYTITINGEPGDANGIIVQRNQVIGNSPTLNVTYPI